MADTPENTETSEDPYADPEIAEIWADAAEVIGDATLAKEAINMLVPRLWNLNWQTWSNFAEAVTNAQEKS